MLTVMAMAFAFVTDGLLRWPWIATSFVALTFKRLCTSNMQELYDEAEQM